MVRKKKGTNEVSEEIKDDSAEIKECAEETAVAVDAEPHKQNDEDYCVYIGPTFTGLIQNGTIYKGPKEKVLYELSSVLAEHPTLSHFIVRGEELARKKIELQVGGTYLHKEYLLLANGKK